MFTLVQFILFAALCILKCYVFNAKMGIDLIEITEQRLINIIYKRTLESQQISVDQR
jgi:hypothetical protein